MEILIQELATKYPAIITTLTIIGGLRVIFKPLTVYVEEYVLKTESKEDDKKFQEVKDSKAFKVFSFILDYTSSIKLK